MKKSLIILFLFIITSCVIRAQNPWYRLNSPTTTQLIKISFTDSLYGWVSGDSGVIIHTTNGGLNWTMQNSNLNYYINYVHFVNRSLGWGLAWQIFDSRAYGTVILKTTNGGQVWDTTFYENENVFLRTVYFFDAQTGFMAGSPANIIKTTDGGTSWNQCTIDSSIVSQFPVISFAWWNRDYGFAAGGVIDIAGVIWKTTNGGLRWTPSIVSPEPVYSIKFFDSLSAIAIAGDFEYGPSILRTSNAGANWKYETLGYFGLPGAMGFRTGYEAWAPLGFVTNMIVSHDSGESWQEILNPDSVQINDLIFVDSLHGFAVGVNGVILKFDPNLVGISNNGEIYTKDYILYQNYPNPFNPSTTISYTLGNDSYVKLEVFDVNGRMLQRLKNENQKKGNYNIRFTGDKLPSGIYFYKLTAESLSSGENSVYQESRKMILLK